MCEDINQSHDEFFLRQMKKKSEQVALFKQLGQYRLNKAAEGVSFDSYVPSFFQSSKQMDYEDPIFDWNIK